VSTDKSIKEHRDKTVVCLPDLDDQVAATPAAQELFAEMKKKNMGTLADLLEGKVGQKDRINVDELFRLGQAIGMTQMKHGKPAISPKNIWVSLSDLAPGPARPTLPERAVYSHLLRHSRLEDRLRLRFSILWLARGNRVSTGCVRLAVRRLVAKGALRLVERTKAGHVVEVRLPGEIRAVRPERGAGGTAGLPGAANLEEMDFLQTKPRREAIHARERSVCFYCLRRLTAHVRCLDHVVPQVRRGSNSYRNVVSSCAECNALKGETAAEDFLRGIYRDGRLTAPELTGRLRAVEALAAGKLRPALHSEDAKDQRHHAPSR
jgi:hypothetical protein